MSGGRRGRRALSEVAGLTGSGRERRDRADFLSGGQEEGLQQSHG